MPDPVRELVKVARIVLEYSTTEELCEDCRENLQTRLPAVEAMLAKQGGCDHIYTHGDNVLPAVEFEMPFCPKCAFPLAAKARKETE